MNAVVVLEVNQNAMDSMTGFRKKQPLSAIVIHKTDLVEDVVETPQIEYSDAGKMSTSSSSSSSSGTYTQHSRVA